ncbi:phage integrase SAM-like domain-containing protein [Clostridium frigidicarnis]|uniref:Integrase/recombinase XerD n=1 Tax=Clostridium frigidicarnis TaxID=84698 RepID=A0A1I1B0D9_9CLOT|nr:phage integrase SAM-like domain-containing protein [Clostridium frigidicarnis]SFB43252.1 integrase/recombinase XerD [Clostridium frigidicarnis]
MRKKLSMNKSNTMTFAMGFEEYIDNCKVRNLRSATIKRYKESINTIYKFIDSSTPLEELAKDTLDKFVINCKENLKINDVILHTYLRELKTLMYYFMRCDYIPTFKIQLTKVNKKPVETYTDG